jgi:uncharacterized protein (TIGR02271 family)
VTTPPPIPFRTGAKLITRDGREIATLEEVRGCAGHGQPALLVARMSATDKPVLIPMAMVNIALSNFNCVQLNGDDKTFKELGMKRSNKSQPDLNSEEDLTIPVHEEELVPFTRDVHLGDVVVHKRVQEVPYEETLDLVRDEVSVEHVPVNREIDEAPDPHYEGETLIVPVIEEVLVTEKRLVLREEIRITRSRQTEQTTVRDILRREIVDIEQRSAQDEDLSTS